MEVIEVPPGTQFRHIWAERIGHKKIYYLRRVREIPWVTQRLPQLMKVLNEGSLIRVFASTCYRVLRGETRSHRTGDVVELKCVTTQELNALILETGCKIVTAEPDLWELE